MENSVIKFHFFKKLLPSNRAVDFVEICNVCAKKAIINVAKRKINSDKICRSYSDLNFGVTFSGTQCVYIYIIHLPPTDLHCFQHKMTCDVIFALHHFLL